MHPIGSLRATSLPLTDAPSRSDAMSVHLVVGESTGDSANAVPVIEVKFRVRRVVKMSENAIDVSQAIAAAKAKLEEF